MKQFARIGGLLILLGVILFSATMTVCGWDFTRISTRPQYQEQQLTVKNTNQTIQLSDQDKAIFVGPSEDEDIHLIYFNRGKESYQIDDGDVLSMTYESSYHWYDNILLLDFQLPSVTILLPANFQGSMDLQTTSSKISISDVTAKQAICSTRGGAVYVSHVTGAESLALSTTANKIELSDVQLTGALDCQTSDGAILLTDIFAGNLHALTSEGAIVSNNTQTSGTTALKTADARIELENVGVDGDLSLSNKEGKIEGTIAGSMQDFSIQSKATNGTCNLPEYSTAGDKKLEVTTSDATISLAFTH